MHTFPRRRSPLILWDQRARGGPPGSPPRSDGFIRGPERLLSEFANYFHYGYHECMKNLVHYLTTVERMETKDTKYARILAFLQSKARFVTEPLFTSLGSLPEPDFSYQLHPGPECPGSGERALQDAARLPPAGLNRAISVPPEPSVPAPAGRRAGGPQPLPLPGYPTRGKLTYCSWVGRL
uniref:Helt bHLH transcription factor n=1 Tax=Bubo bubo TaxID=30461 RepID=A0A8C0EWV7_BUBBB